MIQGVSMYVDGKPVKLKVLHRNLGPFYPTRDPLRIGAAAGVIDFVGRSGTCGCMSCR